MAASNKTNTLCQLWDITPSVIHEKVTTLKAIIGDVSDIILLDYLTKCDLNIEQCVNLHFSQNDNQSPTPIPPLIDNIANTNNNTNNNSNNSPNNADTQTTDQSSNNNSNNANDRKHKPLQKKRRRPKRKKKPAILTLWDDSDEEYMPNTNNNNNNTNKKKRTRQTNNVSQPRTKKRKLSLNTKNTNSKQERDSEDEKDENKNENQEQKIETRLQNNIPTIPTVIHWKLLQFGSFKIRYTVKDQIGIHLSTDLFFFHAKGKIKFKLNKPGWFKASNSKLDKLYGKCISEIYSQFTEDTRIKINKKTNEIENKNKSNKIYETEFNISYQRPLICSNRVSDELNMNSLEDGFSATLAIVGGNNEIYNDFIDTNNLLRDYKKNNKSNSGIITLEGLLDFSCKYKHKLNQREKREMQSKYQLNVQLYEYQLQTISYMINEENNPIGFYSRLFKFGKFENSDSFYYYSSAFKQLIVNKHLPIAHGGFICEEMGLGKTIESLALINYNQRKDEYSTENKLIIGETVVAPKINNDMFAWFGAFGHTLPVVPDKIYYKSRATLIVAPVSLVGQWEKECVARSNRKISFKRYYASYRKRDIALYIEQDIVFTTYGIIGVEDGQDRKKHVLHCIQWHRIILDESHYIKNGNTKCARNMQNLVANNKWLLTGTPFGRQVYDIYSQLKFLGLTQADLDNKIKLTILKKKMNKWGIDAKAIPLLKVMKHLMMRHKKTQKFNNNEIVRMTEKDEDIIVIEFTKQQRIYYDKLYNTAKERYETYKATGNIGRGCIALLASLLPSRQACSGHIYSKQEIENELSAAQAKTYRVQQIVSDKRNVNKSASELYDMALFAAYNSNEMECPICYETPFDDPLQTICRHIFCGECIRAILCEKPECPMCRKQCTIRQLKKPPSQEQLDKNKNKNKMDIDNDNENEIEIEKKEEKKEEMIRFDTKLELLIGEINKLKIDSPNDKSLIFTSFSRSLDWICKELSKNGIQYRTLTGSMSMNKRKKALQEFENDANVTVFVLTVRSGAVGITLTAANHVWLMEPPFNPALYRQAINRAHRLGQKKKVFIRTLIMKDSIEERIWNVNEHKQKDTNNRTIAGNINMDKNAKLQPYEISKLFE